MYPLISAVLSVLIGFSYYHYFKSTDKRIIDNIEIMLSEI